jgi:hypothetical protein
MRLIAALLALLPMAVPGAVAQMRTLPLDTERGVIRHIEGPDVTVDGKSARLAPGATIRNRDNLIIVPASLPAEGARAEYVRDAQGMIFRVWLVTSEEAARDRRKR